MIDYRPSFPLGNRPGIVGCGQIVKNAYLPAYERYGSDVGVYDHCVHWVDISRCWLDGRRPESVRALELRSPGQPAGTTQPGAPGSTATMQTGRTLAACQSAERLGAAVTLA